MQPRGDAPPPTAYTTGCLLRHLLAKLCYILRGEC
jgi:hypothetical protein